MDKKALEGLVAEAISRGTVAPSLFSKVRNANEISMLPVSRSILFRIYKRRLKHARGNPVLLESTEELVDFLADYPNDELLMIDVADHDDCHAFLLASRETSKVLHWMRMFGERSPATGAE
ncbi:hypothetical protein ACWZHB_02755 [Nocardia sp. FBN12]|uniref:hypothetical protein n=1 Tax=Nocardia sp. FBN12 TaxID=3419766 RepID=UPI003D08502C